MKKYLITEDQMTRIMLKESTNIKKGLALKVQDEKGEFYKSIIKEFKSEDDFNNWKDNLKSNVVLIGDMDIDDDVSETINESTYDKMPKEKKDIGFYMLFKTLQLRYPFIIDIIPNFDKLKHYGTLLHFDVVFDLNKFYEITNTHYGYEYQNKDHLLELLKNDHHYLSTYTDPKFRDQISNIDKDIRDFMNKYYTTIKPDMRYSRFELWDEEDFRNSGNFDFYIEWSEQKESPSVDVGHWFSVVDIEKLKELTINF
jgi:hypothetical protein